jgi:tetratricopeptide (TPR) repeat protein
MALRNLQRVARFGGRVALAFVLCAGVWAQEDLPQLVKRVKPSVVAVVAFDAKGERIANGSGFFVAPDRVVTNRHVLEGAYKSEIQLTSGKVFAVKGALAVDGAGDIALLQIDLPAGVGQPLEVVKESPQEGETIVVIGNPLGLEGSVSNGIVSAVRDVQNFGRIIQITAPISPGSSGSPVINLRGQVVGVATLQITEGQSLNFAVPSERVVQLQAGALVSLAALDENTKKNQRSAAERLYLQGLGFISRDDCERALPYFKRATETDANYAEAWTQSGFCYATLGRHQESADASRRAVALQPDSLPAQLNLGSALIRLGQFKEAVDAYKKAAALDPYNADPVYALGVAYNKLGKTDDEIIAYKQAVKLKPEYAAAHERLGLAYVKLNRPNDAINSFKQVILLRPGDASAFDNLGTAYIKAKMLKESAEAYQQAIRLKPDFARAYYNLGVCYVAAGNTDAALEQYHLLRSLDADRAARLYNVIYP